MSRADAPIPPSQPPPAELKHEILPTLFGDGYGLYEVRKGSFLASFLLNCAALGLLIWVGTWTASHVPEVKKVIGLSVDISPYMLPASPRTVPVAAAAEAHTTPSRLPRARCPSLPRRRSRRPRCFPWSSPNCR